MEITFKLNGKGKKEASIKDDNGKTLTGLDAKIYASTEVLKEMMSDKMLKKGVEAYKKQFKTMGIELNENSMLAFEGGMSFQQNVNLDEDHFVIAQALHFYIIGIERDKQKAPKRGRPVNKRGPGRPPKKRGPGRPRKEK